VITFGVTFGSAVLFSSCGYNEGKYSLLLLLGNCFEN